MVSKRTGGGQLVRKKILRVCRSLPDFGKRKVSGFRAWPSTVSSTDIGFVAGRALVILEVSEKIGRQAGFRSEGCSAAIRLRAQESTRSRKKKKITNDTGDYDAKTIPVRTVDSGARLTGRCHLLHLPNSFPMVQYCLRLSLKSSQNVCEKPTIANQTVQTLKHSLWYVNHRHTHTQYMFCLIDFWECNPKSLLFVSQ